MYNAKYKDFLKSKKKTDIFDRSLTGEIHEKLKPFQKDCCEYLMKLGRGAAFLDTGLGKTILQCEWSRHVKGNVLFVAPLAVAQQTIKEAQNHLGMTIEYSRDGNFTSDRVITNYERLDNFDESKFDAVVLDESSILKGQNSKTKEMLCSKFADTTFKLACTATPAPNDYKELGNHAEFLGIMSSQEMLMRWFVHDSANTSDWRLKKHAVKDFWRWVSSWSACVSNPSDLGYSGHEYELPPLNIDTHVLNTEMKETAEEGFLFDTSKFGHVSSADLGKWKRHSVEDRVKKVADMVNESDKPFIVWCESNQESELLTKSIPDGVEVKGSDSPDLKEKRLNDFSEGRSRVIISKSSICGFGMNWQHCRDMVFASINYSYEKFYQAVRRSWRFGQDQSVNVHVFIADAELSVWRAIESKSTDHNLMKDHMKYAVFSKGESAEVKIDYNPNHKGRLPAWI